MIPDIVFIASVAGGAASALMMTYVGTALAISVMRGTSSRHLVKYSDSLSAANSFRVVMVAFFVVMFFVLPQQAKVFGMTVVAASAMLTTWYGYAMLCVLVLTIFASIAIAVKSCSDTRVKGMVKGLRFNSMVVAIACLVLATMLGA